MQYDVETPEDYYKAMEEDWRKERLLKVREYILTHGPELKEGIQYKMLSFGSDSSIVFHLNAQKSYVSLYVGDIEKITGDEELLKGLDYGKGCIRIKKSVDLDKSRLEEFVRKTVEAWRGGRDVSC
ncbi:hypothetical protein AAV35_011105 [Salimicrobium jeotgali]|uniref:YdhG-like domain-containing protein n=1 Tax=Salimicrobium jeotgali TaxID=1230341 RepID=K2GPL1_9BACI|nr:DUF1801 domain-containing protein [Salimicrobium jeotgali]AKG05274.1 hypothetical protein AAV35_011105 [Salimicrobium jeotgali]EKE32334.1 hypothetical protein MJ3_02807 [Salimicrobium jeotgali]MBM7695691.1 uncharacterized protein YdhG (YjbR/CyaY superfamily) [Salimicrobium jeotgali]